MGEVCGAVVGGGEHGDDGGGIGGGRWAKEGWVGGRGGGERVSV